MSMETLQQLSNIRIHSLSSRNIKHRNRLRPVERNEDDVVDDGPVVEDFERRVIEEEPAPLARSVRELERNSKYLEFKEYITFNKEAYYFTKWVAENVVDDSSSESESDDDNEEDQAEVNIEDQLDEIMKHI